MTQDRVMLLIDADNVSIDIMEQAVQLLHKQHGGVHVRRAYCTAESAVKHQAAFKRLGIKPMVNLAAGKNSTDIALAVDAIDLVLSERPEVVVIASSDSDFAPLVQRLREKGCEVRGIGQLGKTGQETQDVYDDFTVLEHRKSADAPAVKRPPARKAAGARKTAVASKAAASSPDSSPDSAPTSAPASKKAPAAKKAARKSAARPAGKAAAQTSGTTAPAPASPVDDTLEAQAAAAFADAVASDEADLPHAAPSPKPARKRAARKSVDERVAASTAAARTAPAAAPEPESEPVPAPPAPRAATAEKAQRGNGQGRASLDAVLACLPELQAGRSLPLSTAARRLRDAQLLGESSKSTKLFAHWPERFDLVPADHPSEVRLRAA